MSRRINVVTWDDLAEAAIKHPSPEVGTNTSIIKWWRNNKMNELFVLCQHCEEEAGILKGDREFVCARCKKKNLVTWGLRLKDKKMEKYLKQIKLEEST